MTSTIVISGPERHRRWPDEEKMAILVEAFAPGASPIEVARRHGISSGLLYTWRKKVTAAAAANWQASAEPSPTFLLVVVENLNTTLPAPSSPSASPAPIIEVQLKNGPKVRIEAGMPEALIAATLKALR